MAFYGGRNQETEDRGSYRRIKPRVRNLDCFVASLLRMTREFGAF
jgi:hypothetical protein